MKNFIKIYHLKRFGKIQIFAIFLIFVFSSCSNLFGKTDLENSSSSENQNSSLVINLKSQSRYIAAQDYDISDITSWDLAYTQLDQKSETKFISWSNVIQIPSSSSSNSPSLSYSKEAQTLTVNNFPSGTYSIAVTGTGESSDSNSNIEIFGSATGVKISSDSVTTEIFLGLKKTSEGTGTLSLNITDTDTDTANALSDLSSNLLITLKSLSGDKTYTRYPAGDNNNTSTLKFEKSENSENVYVLSNADGQQIASGFYLLSFYFDNNRKIVVPSDKLVIEIADGIETTGTIDISVILKKIYYATNSDSNGNGLASSSRANLTKLLNSIAENLPEEGEINIYVDDVPEINIDAVDNIKSKINGIEKIISIYGSSTTSSETGQIAEFNIAYLDETGDSSSKVSVSVSASGALTISSGEKNSELEIEQITVPASEDQNSPAYKITLKNGASLNITGNIVDSFSGLLAISPITEDSNGNKTENFYFAKPFIKTTSKSLLNNIVLYNSNDKNVTDSNLVLKEKTETSDNITTYSYYINPVEATEQFSKLAEDYNNAKITVALGGDGDSQTSYYSGNPVPYKDDSLIFTLNFQDDVSIANFAWYDNSKNDNSKIISSQSNNNGPLERRYTISSMGELKNAQAYSYSYYFVLDNDEKIYKTDFKLNFEEIEKSAAVYFDSINATSSQNYALKQYYIKGESSTVAELISDYSSSSGTSPIYTFDSNFSLYVPKFNDTGVSSVNRYLMSSSDKSYTTGTEFVPSSESFSAENFKLQDIYYANDYLYMLFVEYDETNTTPKSGILYASNGSENLYSSSNITISEDSDTPDGTTVTVVPMQIALNGNKLYVAGNDCNIYSTTINLNDPSQIEVYTFERLASCTENLTEYNETLHNDGEILITDMQLGDGLGYETGTLYVLIREASESIDTNGGLKQETNFPVVLSRGALIEIDTDTSTTTKIKNVYGWSETFADRTLTTSTIRYYGPTSTSGDVKFYGPTHFAAVVPKKLVILDDGIDFQADNNNGTVINKDSFVEFEIDFKTLTRTNENISASMPYVSGFTRQTSSGTN